jgi:hypothetical protein
MVIATEVPQPPAPDEPMPGPTTPPDTPTTPPGRRAPVRRSTAGELGEREDVEVQPPCILVVRKQPRQLVSNAATLLGSTPTTSFILR